MSIPNCPKCGKQAIEAKTFPKKIAGKGYIFYGNSKIALWICPNEHVWNDWFDKESVNSK